MEKINALNPNAQPWEPKLEKTKIKDRSNFFTFARKHPLSTHQITNFFARNYGDCIEKIYLHNPNPAQPPLFGQVVFTKCTIPAMILRGQEEKHFVIDNRTLFCKKFKH